MSESPKRPFALMWDLATRLVGKLAPACTRVEIAGSLRRRKALVGDIEIVAIPIPILNLLGEPTEQTEVDVLLSSWPITMSKNGAKYKQFSFAGNSGALYRVDLFLQPDARTWGINLLLRTGSAEFSHKMVTPKRQGGYMPDDCSVRDARVWRNGTLQNTPEEADVFALWDMPWIAPSEREVRKEVMPFARISAIYHD